MESSGTTGNQYVVLAPAGKLGIVLDSPDDMGSVVYVIKENSPLLERMEVGDRLLAVDEIDVRAMSPTKVSKLISKRSRNPLRKLTLARDSVKQQDDSMLSDEKNEISDEEGYSRDP
jgi:C-terminal processing protease CtpA/Prc